jgi:SanA protein
LRRRNRLRRTLWWLAGFFVVFVLLCNRWVINSTDAYIYTNWALLPENDVGIVLGTSPYTRDGKPNPQFYGRIEAAALLYGNGKVKHLIVSGANPDVNWNEPREMRRELVKLGVPEKDITYDFAGFRTFDSMQRASLVFQLDRATIITQRYHAYRAVFLGKKFGVRTVAFVARANAKGDYGSRNPMREVFARVKAVLDLFVLRTSAKFLGAPEKLDIRPDESMPGNDPGARPEPPRAGEVT